MGHREFDALLREAPDHDLHPGSQRARTLVMSADERLGEQPRAMQAEALPVSRVLRQAEPPGQRLGKGRPARTEQGGHPFVGASHGILGRGHVGFR